MSWWRTSAGRIRIRASSSVISRNFLLQGILQYAMTYFPQPHSKRRAVRVTLAGTPSTAIRFDDGRCTTGKLQIVSVTGGLLRMPKPLCPGALVEIMFLTQFGPVLGMAELLSPCSATLRCLQPFRFIILDDAFTDLKLRLRRR